MSKHLKINNANKNSLNSYQHPNKNTRNVQTPFECKPNDAWNGKCLHW
jgi:hypothetical protein